MINNLLIVGHFSSSVGYAWDTIREYFLALGRMFRDSGGRAMICYPAVDAIPDKFRAAGIDVVEFDFFTRNAVDLYRFVRKNRIRVLYVTDGPVFSLRYLTCRLAGVKWIVVHDRTSGERDTPGILKKWAKKMINHYPLLSADMAIGISEFVRQRLVRVSCFPERRTVKIWNGIDIEKFSPGNDDFVFRRFNIPRGKKIVFSYSRANKYKGIQTLIEAADILIRETKRDDLCFLYCGDGPDLEHFRSLVQERKLTGCFLCPGKTGDVDRILKGVHIVVVPPVWQEGFGLSVIEGMATGKPVIASKVGGIKEIITDSEDGYLVPPGDVRALSAKISDLLNDEGLQKRMGEAARRTVIRSFNLEDKKKELSELFNTLVYDSSIRPENAGREGLYRRPERGIKAKES